MKDVDFIIEEIKLQAEQFIKDGDEDSATAILSLINSSITEKQDNIKVGVSMTATVEKIDGDI